LLWDVPEAQHRRVIQSLRDRSLVEFCNGEYWLHPVIRAEAINRLRESEDWETANRKAAEFWTESIKTVETIEDVLTAFEAYYHCIEISDFELACNVILEKRSNKWEEDEPLGASFYRLGLLRPMISNINHMINYINLGLSLGILYNLLGDLYWKSGNIHEAIECHKLSGDIASNALVEEQELEEAKIITIRMQVASFLNRGLCKLDLFEIEKLKIFFRIVF
jgi:tetratricopeptide (TPR) repeat protein